MSFFARQSPPFRTMIAFLKRVKNNHLLLSAHGSDLIEYLRCAKPVGGRLSRHCAGRGCLSAIAILSLTSWTDAAEQLEHGFYITGGAGWTKYNDFDADNDVTRTADSWAAMIGVGWHFLEIPVAVEFRGTYARHLAPDGVSFLPELNAAAIPVTRVQVCGLYMPRVWRSIHPYVGPCIGGGFLGVDPTGRDAVPVGDGTPSVAVGDIGVAVDGIIGARFNITRDRRFLLGVEFGYGWVTLASRKGVDHEDESPEKRAMLTITWRLLRPPGRRSSNR